MNIRETKIDRSNRMRFGHRWTTEELTSLMQLWDSDTHVNDIAEALGCSTSAVGKMVVRLRAQGIPLKRRTKGRRLGDSNRAGHLWTQAEIEYLVMRRRDRATSEEIAIELGRSYLSINGMIQRLRREKLNVPRFGRGMRRLYDISSLKLNYGEEKLTIQ